MENLYFPVLSFIVRDIIYQMTFSAYVQWQDFIINFHVFKDLWMNVKTSFLYNKISIFVFYFPDILIL